MNLNVFPSKEALNETLAARVIACAKLEIAAKEQFNFVLTGGSSPIALYELLSGKYKNAIDWTKVYFFIGDERNVAATDKDYNGGMVKKALLNNLGVSDQQMFYVNTNLSPKVAAADYFERIQKHFKGTQPVFDFILLGMGTDAHTASLFPETSILDSVVANVAATYVAKLGAWRISLTAKMIGRAKEIAFLVFGHEKAPAIAEVLQGKGAAKHYPAKLIQGNVHYYIDAEAASQLK